MPGLDKTFSPPQVAERWGIKPEKVLKFLKRGELEGFNVASAGARARYRVTLQAIEAFERQRSAARPKPAPKRRRKDPAVHEFF